MNVRKKRKENERKDGRVNMEDKEEGKCNLKRKGDKKNMEGKKRRM